MEEERASGSSSFSCRLGDTGYQIHFVIVSRFVHWSARNRSTWTGGLIRLTGDCFVVHTVYHLPHQERQCSPVATGIETLGGNENDPSVDCAESDRVRIRNRKNAPGCSVTRFNADGKKETRASREAVAAMQSPRDVQVVSACSYQHRLAMQICWLLVLLSRGWCVVDGLVVEFIVSGVVAGHDDWVLLQDDTVRTLIR